MDYLKYFKLKIPLGPFRVMTKDGTGSPTASRMKRVHRVQWKGEEEEGGPFCSGGCWERGQWLKLV